MSDKERIAELEDYRACHSYADSYVEQIKQEKDVAEAKCADFIIAFADLTEKHFEVESQRNELEQALKMATDTIAEYQHVLAMFDDEGSYEIHVEIDQDDNCHILMSADDWYRLQALSSMKRVHPQSFMDQGDN